MNDRPSSGESESAGFDFMLGTSRANGTEAPTPTDGALEPVPFTPLTRADAKRARAAAVDSRSLIVPLAIAVGALLVLGGAGYAAWSMVQASEAQVKSDSAAFCANLDATPGVLDEPAFGWPAEVTDLPTSLLAIREYQARWESIASEAPPTIREDVVAIAVSAKSLADNVESTKTIDRPSLLAQMQIVTNETDVRAWHEKYCG